MWTKVIIAVVFVGLVGGGVWQYTRMATKIGSLEQSNKQLVQTNKDQETALKTYSDVAAINHEAVINAERAKSKYVIYAAKLSNELEVLKNENAEIKEWARVIMPDLLAYRLLVSASNYNGDRLFDASGRPAPAYAGTWLVVRNENHYDYTGQLQAALKSCNKDKAEVLVSITKIKALLGDK